MANLLLDFVMSLRDPDALARYENDPSQAIADANLTDVVTPADVSSLLPVVSESLSMGAPTTGGDAAFIDDAAGNVWASGAATAAFDAFADHVPDQMFDDAHSLASDLIDPHLGQSVQSGLDALDDGVPAESGFEDPSLQLVGGVIDDPAAEETALAVDDGGEWGDTVADDQHLDADATGFDVF